MIRRLVLLIIVIALSAFPLFSRAGGGGGSSSGGFSSGSSGGFSSGSSSDNSLSRPRDLRASKGVYTNKVHLSWDKVSGASKYMIYRSYKKNSGYKKVATVVLNQYDDKNVEQDKVYFYKLKADSPSRSSSSYSDVVRGFCVGIPMMPKAFKALKVTASKARLKWQTNIFVDIFHIYRSKRVNGPYKKRASIRRDTEEWKEGSWRDKLLTPQNSYYYKILAVNKAGESKEAPKIKITTTKLIPITGVPKLSVVEDGVEHDRVSLKWTKVRGAEDYNIYRRLGTNGKYEFLDVEEYTEYTDKGLEMLKTYSYRVSAVNIGGEGDKSSVLTVKTKFNWIFVIIGVLIAGVALIFAVFIIIGKNVSKKRKEAGAGSSPIEASRGYEAFIGSNPDFNYDEFKTKVETAFIAIQDAWTNMNLSGVRRYISDGVYQRFTTQFTMMKVLKQTNPLSNIKVHSIDIADFEQDGVFDIIHVRVTASLNDKFVCDINHSMDSGGHERFSEYWSFIRKSSTAEGKDMYNSTQCPSCAAPLEGSASDTVKCEYCGALLNSGEYDWVLSEITQESDFGSGQGSAESGVLAEGMYVLEDEDPLFTKQEIEDKVSNGFMQIKTAEALQSPEIMRRFVSDELFEKLKSEQSDENMVYNRLYTNSVSVIGAKRDEGFYRLFVSLRYTYQKALVDSIEDANSAELKGGMNSEDLIIELRRKQGAEKSKGSLYARICPSCGAPVEDSLKMECEYCGNVFNNAKHEWIIQAIEEGNDAEELL